MTPAREPQARSPAHPLPGPGPASEPGLPVSRAGCSDSAWQARTGPGREPEIGGPGKRTPNHVTSTSVLISKFSTEFRLDSEYRDQATRLSDYK